MAIFGYLPSFLTLGDNKILVNFLGITAYVWVRELGVGKWGSSPFILALESREFSCFLLYKT